MGLEAAWLERGAAAVCQSLPKQRRQDPEQPLPLGAAGDKVTAVPAARAATPRQHRVPGERIPHGVLSPPAHLLGQCLGQGDRAGTSLLLQPGSGDGCRAAPSRLHRSQLRQKRRVSRCGLAGISTNLSAVGVQALADVGVRVEHKMKRTT